MLPRPFKAQIWGFRLGGAPHKVDLLRRPANLYKTPAKPQMYAQTHQLTHTHINTQHAHTHTHTKNTLFDGFATFITFPYEIVCF